MPAMMPQQGADVRSPAGYCHVVGQFESGMRLYELDGDKMIQHIDETLTVLLADSGNPNAILQKLNSPNWNEGGRVHNWRNHIPEVVEKCWEQLPLAARVVAYVMAEKQASMEEWE